MAKIKWIKTDTDIFNNRKIRQIEMLPEGDTIIIIWMKLLGLAGNINDYGMVYLTKEMPYTDEMLAAEFGRPLPTVRLALATFERFGMIEIIDDIYHISNWEKYQNIEGMERIREQTRKRVAKYRENQKLLECNVTVTQCNETEKNRKEENRIEEEKEREKINYQQIVDMYNDTCVSFPKVVSISDSRKKAIKARLKTYSIDDFRTVFQKAEASTFMKGGNARNWSANFDWMIKDSNFAKILDGNYDTRKTTNNNSVPVQDDLDGFF